MQIHVRFFAILKDRAGVSQATIDLPSDATVQAALSAVAERYPHASQDLKRSATAVNRNYVSTDAVLNEGDELALIPPVSGG